MRNLTEISFTKKKRIIFEETHTKNLVAAAEKARLPEDWIDSLRRFSLGILDRREEIQSDT